MNPSRAQRKWTTRLTGLFGVVAFGVSLQAGNPIFICESGQPYVWPQGGVGIPFNPDQGTLGPMSNADAAQLVQKAFGVWQAVPDCTMTSTNAGRLPVDVTVDNFSEYLFASQPDGLSAIVFDSNGQIFNLLFGANSGILGFAGPEWVDPENCTIVEGLAFLNGPQVGNRVAALDIMVHEFGHYLGLGHSAVNGQIFLGDTSGPTPFDPFGQPALAQLETMYPFYFGSGSGFSTLEKDDSSALASLYPDAAFGTSAGTIQGVIRAADGITPLSGVNVIARNLAQPFQDAVSAVSGAYAVPSSPDDPMQGVYTLSGLTPGAQYVIYTDRLTQGEFIRTSLFPFPGPEEFYNGAAESDNVSSPDPPDEYAAVSVSAGDRLRGVDVIFNAYLPGESLPVGDEGYVLVPLPFPFRLAGEEYGAVWVNANGHLTFGAPPVGDDYDVTTARFLNGPPRIAGLWTDLDSGAGGTVTYEQTTNTFTVLYSDVPEWFYGGSNTFHITLHRGSSEIDVEYGTLTAEGGIAGVTAGAQVTSGAEAAVDLSHMNTGRIDVAFNPAVYELFGSGNVVDLSGQALRYGRMRALDDHWAGSNNTLHQARWIELPFSSLTEDRFTEIEPAGQDVDFYKFHLDAGQVLVAEIVRASFDSLLGLFDVHTGWDYRHQQELLTIDDRPGNLSSLIFVAPESGTYAVAVTAAPDVTFEGHGGGGGRYVLELTAVTPEPGEVVVNGGFEYGKFLGWTALETGVPYLPWQVTGAGFGGTWTMAPTRPQDGQKVAWNGFDGDGPMQFLLYQDLEIPEDGPMAVLRWKDRAQCYFFSFQPKPRVVSVQFRDPDTDVVLETLHSFDTGTGYGHKDSGWQEHEVDVSAYRGRRVRLLFQADIPEAYSGPGQLELDSVSLRVGPGKLLTSAPAPAPKLTILPDKGGGMTVHWTPESPGWVLQQSAAGTMGDWVDCTAMPQTLGTTRFIEVTPSNACQFFRLLKR